MPGARTEVWMRGPVPEVDPYLQPVIHSLLQVKEEIEALLPLLTAETMWARPGGVASVAFHLDHIGGSLDRLLTYAKGESLAPAQFEALSAEGASGNRATSDVATGVLAALDRAIDQIKRTPHDDLLTPRKVGRAGLPSTTLGLLFHAAEHATRHAGQALTTAKMLRGS